MPPPAHPADDEIHSDARGPLIAHDRSKIPCRFPHDLERIPVMRRLLAIFLCGIPLCSARAGEDLSSKIQLAREAQDAHSEIELLRRWLDANPKDNAAVERLVTLWLAVRDYAMATSALGLSPDIERGFAARSEAEIAWNRDDSQERAIAILTKRLTEAPKDRLTRKALAQDLGRAGRINEQLAQLDILIAAEEDANLLLTRANARLAIGDGVGAEKDFVRAAAVDPDGEAVQQARPAFERLGVALKEIAAISRNQQESPASTLDVAFWNLYAGMPATALALADKGSLAWPASASAAILSACAKFALGSLTSEKALTDFSVNVSAPLENSKARQAILLADAALSKSPSDSAALLRRAQALADSQQPSLALNDLNALLEQNPKNIAALQLAVSVQSQLGNPAAATACATRLAAINAPAPIVAGAFASLARIAFDQYNFQLAQDLADRSIAARPTADVWNLKSACYTRTGQPNEAAQALRKAAALKK